jgi:pimeloyl-ACP methyl ester carboxylesterase
MSFSEVVPAGAAQIEVLRITERRPEVFLLPGAAGGVSAYGDLCERLTAAGLPTVGLNPRGCGASVGDLQDLTLKALADDVAAVIAALHGTSAVLIGHAGGNRIARMVATEHPGVVRGTVLLAAGGKVPAAKGAYAAMRRAMDPTLSDDERARAAAEAFFAPANRRMAAQTSRGDRSEVFFTAFQKALQQVPVDHWWAGGTAPMLVIQGKEDRVAVPANGRLLADAYPKRVRVVDIENAGHSLFMEQPERITQLIVEWVGELPPA